MNEILHANIFFFIASVGFVLLTLLVCVILFHVLKIIKSIRRIVERIEVSSEVISEDVAQLRAYVREGGFVSKIISFFMSSAGRRSRRTSRTKEPD